MSIEDARTHTFDALNVVAIDVAGSPEARVLPLCAGLPDAMFEHDGQITKRAVRAVTLSSLAPKRGQLLWDIGAGSGSVSIEWMLADRSMRAVAVERDAGRAATIRRNAGACGVPGIEVIEAGAPDCLKHLPAPDAVFIGGGGSEPVFQAAMDALPASGRLVANAVTLETQTLITACHARLGGDLLTLGVANASAVGARTAMRPAMPVTQWIWVKP